MEEFREILNLILESQFFNILKTSFWIVFVVIWLGGISFVIKDAKRRYQKPLFQNLVILLPLFFHIAGLLAYLLIRPAETQAEKAYGKELLGLGEELFGCPSCGAEIKEGFIFCPKCGSELFDHCENCGKAVKKGWKYCPYCRKAILNKNFLIRVQQKKDFSIDF